MASSAFPHCSPTNMSVGVIFCSILRSPINITCHERPYRSCVHPYFSLNGYSPSSMSAEPPFASSFHNASTSSFVSQATRNAPPHALLVCLDFCQRRTGHGNPRDIVVLEMSKGAIDMIGEKRATGAACVPAWAKHEVINNELASAIEQFSQILFALGTVKDVILLHFHPRQSQTFCVDLVPQMSKFLFLQQQRFARGEPLFLGYH